MKIAINRKEAETILLEWAKSKWPEMNTVEWVHFNSPSGAEFTHDEELEPEEPPAPTPPADDIPF